MLFFQPTTLNVPDSDDSDSDMELTSSTCTGTSSSAGEASRLSKRHHFMQHWLKLYSWVTIEGSGENLVVYCRDCKRAKLSNDFAHGKKQLPKGWKREYLQRHGDSNQHKLQAQPNECLRNIAEKKIMCQKVMLG